MPMRTSARLGVAALSIAILSLTGCASDAPAPTMPDVTGESLDTALSDIERAGFGDDVEILGGGLFGVVAEENWVVCEQLPAAGEGITEQPRLSVDRSCGDDEDSEDEDDAAQDAPAEPYAGPD